MIVSLTSLFAVTRVLPPSTLIPLLSLSSPLSSPLPLLLLPSPPPFPPLPLGTKLYDKAEDPLYVLDHGLAVDSQYYLENQLSKPLSRIFEAIMDNPQSIRTNSPLPPSLLPLFPLVTGEHTRVIAMPTPKTGGIVGFTRVKETCQGCRAPLQSSGPLPSVQFLPSSTIASRAPFLGS